LLQRTSFARQDLAAHGTDPNASGELPCPNASSNGTIPGFVFDELQKDCANHLNESAVDVEKEIEQKPDVAATLIDLCTKGSKAHTQCFGKLINYLDRCKDSLDEANMTGVKEGLDQMCHYMKLFAKSSGSSSTPGMLDMKKDEFDEFMMQFKK